MAGPAVGRLHPGRPGETKGQPKLVDVLSVRPRTRVRFPPPPLVERPGSRSVGGLGRARSAVERLRRLERPRSSPERRSACSGAAGNRVLRRGENFVLVDPVAAEVAYVPLIGLTHRPQTGRRTRPRDPSAWRLRLYLTRPWSCARSRSTRSTGFTSPRLPGSLRGALGRWGRGLLRSRTDDSAPRTSAWAGR
jgi:hypothetical protein